MKPVILRLALASSLVAPAALGLSWPAAAESGSALREQSDLSVPAAGIRLLQVGNARGLISVRAGSATRIRVSALKVARGTDDDVRTQLARETRVESRSEGDRHVIRVLYPQRQQNIRVGLWDLLFGRDVEIPRVEVRLVLEVPPQLAVELDSSSGDLFTDGLTGRQRLESTSGDIEIGAAMGRIAASTTSGDVSADALGAARIATSSGDVRVERAAGAVSVSTSSGDVVVRLAEDSLAVTTGSGDVDAVARGRLTRVRTSTGELSLRATGRVDVESGSGDVRLSLEPTVRGVEVSTATGDVSLALGGRIGAALALETTGTLDVEAPLDVRSASRQQLTGVVRGGAAPVTVRSASGDIHVSD